MRHTLYNLRDFLIFVKSCRMAQDMIYVGEYYMYILDKNT